MVLLVHSGLFMKIIMIKEWLLSNLLNGIMKLKTLDLRILTLPLNLYNYTIKVLLTSLIIEAPTHLLNILILNLKILEENLMALEM